MSNTVDIWIVFDGPPGPESGRFIETEDESGKGVGGGFGWNQYEKYWKLGPFADRVEVVKLEAQLSDQLRQEHEAHRVTLCALETAEKRAEQLETTLMLTNEDRASFVQRVVAWQERAEKAEAENRQRGGPPGEWVCDKCAFALHSRIINAQTGDIGVPRVQEIPDCLNGCGPLRPETWKGLCDSYGETIDRLNESCKQERERAEKAEKKITQFIHGEDRPDAYVTQEEATSLRRELADYKAGQKVGGRVEEIVAAHKAYREVKAELEECRQEQKKAKAEEIQGIKRAAHHRDAFIDMAHEHAAERERGLREALEEIEGDATTTTVRIKKQPAPPSKPPSHPKGAMMHRENIYHLISIERQWQDEKHSWARYNNLRKLAVLTEELGEIARDIQRERDATEELIHLAAAVVRWLEGCPEVEAAAGECEHGVTMPLGKQGITTRDWCYICGAMGAYKDGQHGPMTWRLPGVEAAAGESHEPVGQTDAVPTAATSGSCPECARLRDALEEINGLGWHAEIHQAWSIAHDALETPPPGEKKNDD